mmetsp:Transcript_1002/g.1899  ORF Transcript_1002/g.1899 Transcript_1002/m.1899 type:complete len:89 (-) Transcript_1002:1595-1861(-)
MSSEASVFALVSSVLDAFPKNDETYKNTVENMKMSKEMAESGDCYDEVRSVSSDTPPKSVSFGDLPKMNRKRTIPKAKVSSKPSVLSF